MKYFTKNIIFITNRTQKTKVHIAVNGYIYHWKVQRIWCFISKLNTYMTNCNYAFRQKS